MIVHNVRYRRNDYMGPWRTEPLDVSRLSEADIGRTVIYRDHGRAEAGTLYVMARRYRFCALLEGGHGGGRQS